MHVAHEECRVSDRLDSVETLTERCRGAMRLYEAALAQADGADGPLEREKAKYWAACALFVALRYAGLAARLQAAEVRERVLAARGLQ